MGIEKNMPSSDKTKAQEAYWESLNHKIDSELFVPGDMDSKLPIARIKKLMKIEEDVKNIAIEVPFLFSKITEHFVEELSMTSWMNTETDNRRTIQSEDIIKAIKSDEFYDFLIYVVSDAILAKRI